MKSFLLGVGLGAAIGVWLAPAAGREMRKKLVTRGVDLAQRLEKKLGTPQEEETGALKQGSIDNRETPATLDSVTAVLNTASKTQLQKVRGIGNATARRIIENRPFENEEDVVESKVMPEPVLKKLKDTLADADEEVA